MKDAFDSSFYDDSPTFSEEVLEPRLVAGNDVFLASNFLPSYVYKLVRTLSKLNEKPEGYLSIAMSLQGDLTLKKDGIAQLKKFFGSTLTDYETALFVEDLLALRQSQSLNLILVYSDSRRALIKGSHGVIYDPSNPEEAEENFVSFIDSKPGDSNSPVQIYKSWADDKESLVAIEILEKIDRIANGKIKNSRIVAAAETTSWLEYMSDWYLSNPPEHQEVIENLSADETLVHEQEFLDFLLGFEELRNEETGFDWYSSFDEEFLVLGETSDFGVVVDKGEAINGHIPPLGFPLAMFVGAAPATCVCGKRFIRADGCDDVLW